MGVNLGIFRVVLNGNIAEKCSRTSFRHVFGRNPDPSIPLDPGLQLAGVTMFVNCYGLKCLKVKAIPLKLTLMRAGGNPKESAHPMDSRSRPTACRDKLRENDVGGPSKSLNC